MPENVIHALLAKALAHHQAGHLAQADHDYRAILAIESNHADAWHLRGLAAHQGGDYTNACIYIELALSHSQRPGLYLNSMGLALVAAHRFAEAEAMFREALAQDTQQVEWWRNLAQVLQQQGKLAEVITCCQRLLQLSPQDAAAYKALGQVYDVAGQFETAAQCYRASLAIQTDDAETYNNLGISLSKLARYQDAEICLRTALALNPNFVEALNNLGMVLRETAQLEPAINCFRRAIELHPRYETAQRNLLTTLLYQADISQETLFQAHLAFAETVAQPLYAEQWQWLPDTAPRTQLRVGWLSSDFRDHPVARNILPLLKHHNRERFSYVLYADVATPDAMSKQLADQATQWRPIFGLSDRQVAQQIHDDKIDILICLASHFDRNRPLVCVYKPAPVQLSFHDAATSGMGVFDYLISDITLTPRRPAESFVERVVRLPTFYIHAPLTEAPPVSARPMQEQGAVVFANFGNPAKFNAHLIALWAQVLQRLPKARLLLKYKNVYADAGVRGHLERCFAQHGVTATRLMWHAQSAQTEAHLAAYAEVDITLDSFPFNGSTTSFESLWMGVPVLTLCGKNMVSRWGAAMLRRAGLEEWIARDDADFVERAQRWAMDAVALSALRARLRAQVAASPLCAEQARARQFERLLRALWRRSAGKSNDG